MKSNQSVRENERLLRRPAWIVLLAVAAGLAAIPRLEAAPNVAVFDTGTPFADTTDPGSRAGWTSVPPETIALEADPSKAISDPGYWGREFAFKGDAVVENHSLTAIFWSAKGRVVVYSKEASEAPAG